MTAPPPPPPPPESGPGAACASARTRRRYGRRSFRRRQRRRWTLRAGFTLLELLVALGLFLGIAFLAAAVMDAQRSAVIATMQGARARRTAAQALDVAAAQLRSVSAADISLASDSLVEFQLPVAEGVVCQSPAGTVVYLPPLGRAGSGARTRWRAMPEDGDVAHFLDVAGNASAGWTRARVQSAALRSGAAICPYMAGVPGVYTTPAMSGEPRLELRLDALPAGVAAGTLVRVQRRMQLVLYRAGDGTGQLGVRRCPADLADPCGGVQPAVGPLLPPRASPGATGLRFAYEDSTGARPGPSELERVTLLYLTARAARRDGHETVERSLALRGSW